jgi:hypothetical protein
MLASTSKKAEGIARGAAGSFTGDGTACIINLGFNPLSFKLVNSTDAIVYEKISGMAANACIKTVTAGTTTIDATSQVLFNGDGTVTIAAASNVAAKAFAFYAE